MAHPNDVAGVGRIVAIAVLALSFAGCACGDDHSLEDGGDGSVTDASVTDASIVDAADDAGAAVDADASASSCGRYHAASPATFECAGTACCSSDGWCWDHPQPHGQRMRDVWLASESEAWAVGDGGFVWHLVGDRVELFQPVVIEALTGVWGSGPADVWAVGTDGTLLHWDGGAWSTHDVGTRAALLAIDGTAADDVWIVGNGFVVLHRDGSGWARVDGPPLASTSIGLSTVLARSRDDVWVTETSAAKAWHFDGSGWAEHSLGEITSAVSIGSDSGAVLVGGRGSRGSDGVNALARNAGAGFERIAVDARALGWRPTGLAGAAGLPIEWAVGYSFADRGGGEIFRRDGDAWTSVDLGLDYALGSAWDWEDAATSGDVLLVVGRGGETVRRAGGAWERLSVGVADRLDLYAFTTDRGALRAVGGEVLTRAIARDEGGRWRAEQRPYVGDVRAAAGGWVFDYAGNAIHHTGSPDGFEGWERYAEPPFGQTEPWTLVASAWAAADDDVWVVGSQRNDSVWRPFLAHWDGSSWTTGGYPVGTVDLGDVYGLAGDRVWAVGSRGTIIAWDGGGWTRLVVPEEARDFVFSAVWAWDDQLWAMGSLGDAVHYDGERWHVWRFAELDPQLRRLWTPLPDGLMQGPLLSGGVLDLVGSGPDDVHAVGDTGVILHWDGCNWRREQSGTLHSLRASARHEGATWAAGDERTVLRRAD